MAKKQTIVGENLTPTLLKDLGAVDKFPRTPAGFQPDGNWTNQYRIWTCHGYRESGNQTVGSLQITRRVDSAKTFVLKVRQEIDQTDALKNIVEGTIICQLDKSASPVETNLVSRFEGPDGKIMPELSHNDSWYFSAVPLTGHASEFSLFEAVQRLVFDDKSWLRFSLLEGMTGVKQAQRLFYRGVFPMKMDGQSLPLYCFVQLGRGILPTEYWLDDRHRLLTVISMNKAYILEK